MNWPGQLALLALRQQNRFRYGLKNRRWRAEGFEIAYLQSYAHEGAPTLIFLHGLGASKDQWGPLIYSLVNSFNCVFVDLPGEGESSFDNILDYSPMAQVERLNSFFEAHSINDIILIGSSIGGCIACLYAAAYPARVSRLIAMAPAGVRAARLSPTMSKFLESGEHPFGYRSVREMQALWDIVFTHAPEVPACLAQALAAKGAMRYMRVRKILDDFMSDGLYPLQFRLAQVKAPVLIVWGSHDKIFDISCLNEIYGLLPLASVSIIQGAGHVPYIECAEETVAVIRRFLSNFDLAQLKQP